MSFAMQIPTYNTHLCAWNIDGSIVMIFVVIFLVGPL